MDVLVGKGGGSSTADAEQVRKIIEIIQARGYRYFVLSASGVRKDKPINERGQATRKITDDLIKLKHNQGNQNVYIPLAQEVRQRFGALARELDVRASFSDDLLFLGRPTELSEDAFVSRGENVTSKIVAAAGGFEFVDSTEIIKFQRDGKVDILATERARDMLLSKKRVCIIPGFYGAMAHNGDIKTFPRNYSDVSGAWVARIVGANEYHIYSDTPMMCAHPDIVPHARQVEVATYDETTELASMGATVIHPATLHPLEPLGTPIRLLNTNYPADKGTLIIPDAQLSLYNRHDPIVGIAGQGGYTSIRVQKRLMGEEIGADERIYNVFKQSGINVERSMDNAHNVEIIVRSDSLNGDVWSVKAELKDVFGADVVKTSGELALISTVGASMAGVTGTAARLFGAVRSVGVNVRLFSQVSNEKTITIGVNESDCEKVIHAIHDEFEKPA